MRAIILAAGRGLRSQQADDRQMPECLLPRLLAAFARLLG